MADPELYAPTARTTLKRRPQRGRHDKAGVHAMLDAGVVCQIGYVDDGCPKVLATVFWRTGEQVFWHGARQNGALKAMAGARVCFTVTHLDGLVLARAAFKHSANYRSVMAFGAARLIEAPAQKRAALQAMIERLYPGRWATIRPPTEVELAAVSVLSLDLKEVSAKQREGPPLDADEDLDIPVWAGVAPLSLQAGGLVPCTKLRSGIPIPQLLSV